MQRPSLYFILITLIVVLVFGRIATNDFTYWDDSWTIHHNPRLDPPTIQNILWYWSHPDRGLYMPLTYTVWAGIAAIARVDHPDEFGISLNPWLFHSASILLHAGSAMIVCLILRRLLKRDAPSLIGALLFALHPVQVEAVGWASGLKDLLCGFFALLAIWEYMQFAADQSPSRRWMHYAIALIAFILSMLSKATGTLVPLLAAIVACWGLRKSLRQVIVTLGPWLILSAACAIVARIVQPGVGITTTPLWTRPLIVGDSLSFYLIKLLLPINLSVDYGRQPQLVMQNWMTYVSWLLPTAIAIAIWRVRKSHPLLVAAGLLFVSGMLPVLGFIPFLMQYFSTVADHYLYLPMLGAALALGWMLSRYDQRWLKIACAIWLAILGTLSFIEAGHWQNELTLSQHMIEVNPRSFSGHLSMGNALDRRGRAGEADAHFRKAIELNPNYAQAYEGYAMSLMRAGKIDEAIDNIHKNIEVLASYPPSIRPDVASSYTLLGQAQSARGKYQEAITEFERALAEDPNRAAARKGLNDAKAKLAATRPANAN